MFKPIKTFKSGDSIGEMNVAAVNKGNFANFQCTENTVMLVLNRDDY